MHPIRCLKMLIAKSPHPRIHSYSYLLFGSSRGRTSKRCFGSHFPLAFIERYEFVASGLKRGGHVKNVQGSRPGERDGRGES